MSTFQDHAQNSKVNYYQDGSFQQREMRTTIKSNNSGGSNNSMVGIGDGSKYSGQNVDRMQNFSGDMGQKKIMNNSVGRKKRINAN